MLRVFNYDPDMTPITVAADLSPQFEGMELLIPEVEVFQGDTVTINFSLTQGGNPFDLTGYTVSYQAKAAFLDTSLVFSEPGVVSNPPTNGQVQVTLSAQDLAEPGYIQTQLFLLGQNGLTQTAMQIPMLIHPSV